MAAERAERRYKEIALEVTANLDRNKIAADQVARALQQNIVGYPYSVAQIIPTGSYARNTATGDNVDVDMEVFLNGKIFSLRLHLIHCIFCPGLSKTSRDDFERARQSIKRAIVNGLSIPDYLVRVPTGRKNAIAVQFKYQGVDFDVVPTAQLEGNVHDQVSNK